MTQIGPLREADVKILNFSKTKMAAAAIFKNHKNRDITTTDWQIFAKFGTIMKTVKSPYLRNRLTDFDEIWHGDGDTPLKFRIKKTRWRRSSS